MPSRSRKPLVFVEPMAATQVAELPRGPEWSYEIKFDGYRVLALKDADRVRLLSRKNKDLTRDFPSVAAAVSRIRASTAILDGEIVAVDEAGVPRFQALRRRSADSARGHPPLADVRREVLRSASTLPEPLRSCPPAPSGGGAAAVFTHRDGQAALG